MPTATLDPRQTAARPPRPRQRVRNRPTLPIRDGVGPSWVALPPGSWATMVDFFAERFPLVSRDDWTARMRDGEVMDEHGARVEPMHPYRASLKVYYYRALPEEPPIPFDEVVLFQDDLLVAVDKPHFVPVVPTGRYLQQSLLVRLKRKLGIDTLSPVHRIDRATAGVVLFTVQPATRHAYQSLFSERSVEKHYEAIVPWRPGTHLPAVYRSRLADEASTIRSLETAGEPNTETRLELLEVHGEHARLRLSPVTGRKHQLRVHCAALGMPIVHDDFYPTLLPEGSDDFARPLQLLARTLRFRDPIRGGMREFSSRQSLRFETADQPKRTA
jgi:tRNA pseudouridine32 synthase/23S rRNA pseudouridine746 synthase